MGIASPTNDEERAQRAIFDQAYEAGYQNATEEHQAEIERLRAALKSCPCPGGGWNGMPKGIETTIENCMVHDACGCVFGDALRGAPEQEAAK